MFRQIIDFHAHCFPDDLAPRAVERILSSSPGARCVTGGTLAALRAAMAGSGVTASVVLPVATKASQVATINRAAAALHAPDIIPFGGLHPHTRDIDAQIDFLAANRIRGVKFHPEFQNFYVDDPAVFPLYEALAAAKFIVVFHAGEDPGPFTNDHATPARIAAVCRQFPGLAIVAAHMGGHKMWDEVESCLVGLPIYFETSTAPENFSRDAFARLCRSHGMEQVLFGSDTPWYDQAAGRALDRGVRAFRCGKGAGIPRERGAVAGNESRRIGNENLEICKMFFFDFEPELCMRK